MVVVVGKVVEGRVEIPNEAQLPEGSLVTVLAPEGQETFQLSPGDERALLEAIAQLVAGDAIDGDELLASLA